MPEVVLIYLSKKAIFFTVAVIAATTWLNFIAAHCHLLNDLSGFYSDQPGELNGDMIRNINLDPLIVMPVSAKFLPE